VKIDVAGRSLQFKNNFLNVYFNSYVGQTVLEILLSLVSLYTSSFISL
jgi:hypothetical protein